MVVAVNSATTRHKRRYAPRMPVEQRREALLDAALRVLARDGYDRVSIEAIAREAGVTRPVVYAAYDGLEPLLHALLDRTQRRALASVIRLLPADDVAGDIDAWLIEAAGGFFDTLQREPDIWRPALGITQNAPAPVRERISSNRELIRGFIADALQVGLDRRGGPFLDVELLSHLMLVTAEHFGRLALEDPQRFSKDRLVDAFGQLLAATRPAST